MRRKDKEVASKDEQFNIWQACKVCRVAMVDDGLPYVVPMNFGAERTGETVTLYFHCAKEGRKLDILQKSPRVCVEADCGHRLIEGSTACEYGYHFASVIGEGKAELLTDPAEKVHGLSVLMAHQTGKDFTFTPEQADTVAVLRVKLDACTGKRKA